MPVCDGQTDGQTDEQTDDDIYRASIALRAKKTIEILNTNCVYACEIKYPIYCCAVCVCSEKNAYCVNRNMDRVIY